VGAGGEGIWNVGELGERDKWDNRLETMREVVLLRTWRVLRGGLAACKSFSVGLLRKGGEDDGSTI
jgi:hypothetical protein